MHRISMALTTTLLLLLATSASAAAQQATSAESVGRAYVGAYSRADWDAMSVLMADDMAFVDRTNPDPTFAPVTEGRSAVLTMLRKFGSSGGVAELGFEFPIIFASNNVVVFAGRVNTLSRPPGRAAAYRWRSDQVIALTIRDGKVVRHEDFADYTRPVVERVSAAPDSSASERVAPLQFLLGEWRVTSRYRDGDSTRTGTGRMTGHLSLGGQAIEMISEHDDPFTPGSGSFHDTHVWMMHPTTRKVVGVSFNTLGNRKTNDGEFIDGDLLVVIRGEMFGGGQFINRERYHRAGDDRIDVKLEVSTDNGASWRDAGYSAVYVRLGAPAR